MYSQEDQGLQQNKATPGAQGLYQEKSQLQKPSSHSLAVVKKDDVPVPQDNQGSPLQGAHLLTFSQMTGYVPNFSEQELMKQQQSSQETLPYQPRSHRQVNEINKVDPQNRGTFSSFFGAGSSQQQSFFNKIERMASQKQEASTAIGDGPPQMQHITSIDQLQLIAANNKKMTATLTPQINVSQTKSKCNLKATNNMNIDQSDQKIKQQRRASNKKTVSSVAQNSGSFLQKSKTVSQLMNPTISTINKRGGDQLPQQQQQYEENQTPDHHSLPLQSQQTAHFGKSRTIKFVSKKKHTNEKVAPQQITNSSNYLSNVKQSKSVYLTTMKTVNFDRKQDSSGQKTGIQSDQKYGSFKSNKSKGFDPAKAYGKQFAIQSMQQLMNDSKTPLSVAQKKNSTMSVKQQQNSQAQPTQAKTPVFKSKKFVNQQQMAQSEILAQSQAKPVINQFKRNRNLVDKSGQRVFSEPRPLVQQNQPQLIAGQNEINVSVKISNPQQHQQQTQQCQSENQSSAKTSKNKGLFQRNVQSSSMQKRKNHEITASFKSHANSSQGFRSEEMINLKQSQDRDGGITTRFSFKFNNQNNYQQETGVQLRLTQSRFPKFTQNSSQDDEAPEEEDDNEDQLRQLHKNTSDRFTTKQKENDQLQLDHSPKQYQQNPTLYHSYRTNSQTQFNQHSQIPNEIMQTNSDSRIHAKSDLYLPKHQNHLDSDHISSSHQSHQLQQQQILKTYTRQKNSAMEAGSYGSNHGYRPVQMTVNSAASQPSYSNMNHISHLHEKHQQLLSSNYQQQDEVQQQEQYEHQQYYASTRPHGKVIDDGQLLPLKPPAHLTEEIKGKLHQLNQFQNSSCGVNTGRSTSTKIDYDRRDLNKLKTFDDATQGYNQISQKQPKQGQVVIPHQQQQRILTAHSQQILSPTHQNNRQKNDFYAQINRVPRRKYRPVLPKKTHYPISQSVNNQKSPGLRTERQKSVHVKDLDGPGPNHHNYHPADTYDRVVAKRVSSTTEIRSENTGEQLQQRQFFIKSAPQQNSIKKPESIQEAIIQLKGSHAEDIKIFDANRKPKQVQHQKGIFSGFASPPSAHQNQQNLMQLQQQPILINKLNNSQSYNKIAGYYNTGGEQNSVIESTISEQNITATFLASGLKSSHIKQSDGRLAQPALNQYETETANKNTFKNGEQQQFTTRITESNRLISPHVIRDSSSLKSTNNDLTPNTNAKNQHHRHRKYKNVISPSYETQSNPAAMLYQQNNLHQLHQQTQNHQRQQQATTAKQQHEQQLKFLQQPRTPTIQHNNQAMNRYSEYYQPSVVIQNKLVQIHKQGSSDSVRNFIEQPVITDKISAGATTQRKLQSNGASRVLKTASQGDIRVHNEDHDYDGQLDYDLIQSRQQMVYNSNADVLSHQSEPYQLQTNNQMINQPNKLVVGGQSNRNQQIVATTQRLVSAINYGCTAAHSIENSNNGVSDQIEVRSMRVLSEDNNNPSGILMKDYNSQIDSNSHAAKSANQLLQVQQMSQVGVKVIPADSVSQASSCSRVRAVAPAKVIYNKFFKDKGFLPPVKSANHNTEANDAARQASRSHSVRSQLSHNDAINRTLENLRKKARSPDSVHIIKSSYNHSEQRVVSRRELILKQNNNQKINDIILQKQSSLTSHDGTDDSANDQNFSEHHTNIRSNGQGKGKDTFNSVTKIAARENMLNALELQPNSAQHKLVTLVNQQNQLENGGGAAPIIDSETAQHQSQFIHALNMALSHAPIQQRKHPNQENSAQQRYMTNQITSTKQPKFKQTQIPSITLANQRKNQATQNTIQMNKQNSKQQTQFIMSGGSNGSNKVANSTVQGSLDRIVYTGKQKPEEVMKQLQHKRQQQLEQKQLRNQEHLQKIQIQQHNSVLVDQASAADIVEVLSFEHPNDGGMPDLNFLRESLQTDEEQHYYEQELEKKNLINPKENMQEDQFKEQISQIINSEAHRNEDEQKESLQKIVDKDQQKIRLMSSKIGQGGGQNHKVASRKLKIQASIEKLANDEYLQKGRKEQKVISLSQDKLTEISKDKGKNTNKNHKAKATTDNNNGIIKTIMSAGLEEEKRTTEASQNGSYLQKLMAERSSGSLASAQTLQLIPQDGENNTRQQLKLLQQNNSKQGKSNQRNTNRNNQVMLQPSFSQEKSLNLINRESYTNSLINSNSVASIDHFGSGTALSSSGKPPTYRNKMSKQAAIATTYSRKNKTSKEAVRKVDTKIQKTTSGLSAMISPKPTKMASMSDLLFSSTGEQRMVVKKQNIKLLSNVAINHQTPSSDDGKKIRTKKSSVNDDGDSGNKVLLNKSGSRVSSRNRQYAPPGVVISEQCENLKQSHQSKTQQQTKQCRKGEAGETNMTFGMIPTYGNSCKIPNLLSPQLVLGGAGLRRDKATVELDSQSAQQTKE